MRLTSSSITSPRPIPPRGTLYILGGLPGSGKSTLARWLAQEKQAAHLRIDTIEHALRSVGYRVDGPQGYITAYRIAADNLRLGLNVVADSVNPIEITRAAWRQVALDEDAPLVEIEVICSDPREHRRRVETRPVDIPGFRLPTWEEVVRRDYQPWPGAHIVIDTAGRTVEQSLEDLRQALG